jgi:hypothetical protein
MHYFQQAEMVLHPEPAVMVRLPHLVAAAAAVFTLQVVVMF